MNPFEALPLKAVFHPQASPNISDDFLMIVLHGRGDSPDGFAWLPGALNLPGIHFLMLEAPDPYYDGFSWYDLPPDQLPGIIRSRNLLRDTLDQVQAFGFKAETIFLFGFSQGCLMSLEFGARYPTPLAGYIGLSGYCYDPAALLRESAPLVMKGNWLITHGTQDEVLPAERSREQIKELQAGGFHIEYQEYRKVHTIDEQKELPFIRQWIEEIMKKA